MTSDEARDLFGEALEGTLAPAQKQALDAALASDPELREEYEAYRWVVKGAAAIGAEPDADGEPEPTPDLLAGVQSRLRRRSRGRYYKDRFSQQSGPRSPVPLLVAIVIALTLAATWVAMQSLVTIDPPTPSTTPSTPPTETADPPG
ncbi:MAG: hypothetical protein M3Y87_11710 [Myxococcota bacterium]|nr:hypothetical protein [Myxococcota bacterium]